MMPYARSGQAHLSHTDPLLLFIARNIWATLEVGGRTCKTVTRLRTFLLSRCTTTTTTTTAPGRVQRSAKAPQSTGRVRAPQSTIQRAGPGQQGRPQNQSSPAGCSPAAPCARPALPAVRYCAMWLWTNAVVGSGGVGSARCLPLTPPSQSWQATPPAFLHSDTLSAPVSSP